MLQGAEALAAVYDALNQVKQGPNTNTGNVKVANQGPGGTSIQNLLPERFGIFALTGTQTLSLAGGCYVSTARLYPFYGNINSGTSTALNTASLGFTAQQTFTLVNNCEVGTTFHFVPTGPFQYVTAYRTANFDTNTAGGMIWQFSQAPPQLLAVELVSAGGTNGMYVAGSAATPATYIYNIIYYDQTLATSQSVHYHRTFAGNTTPASSGIVQIYSTSSGYVFDIIQSDESQGGQVCGTV